MRSRGEQAPVFMAVRFCWEAVARALVLEGGGLPAASISFHHRVVDRAGAAAAATTQPAAAKRVVVDHASDEDEGDVVDFQSAPVLQQQRPRKVEKAAGATAGIERPPLPSALLGNLPRRSGARS